MKRNKTLWRMGLFRFTTYESTSIARFFAKADRQRLRKPPRVISGRLLLGRL